MEKFSSNTNNPKQPSGDGSLESNAQEGYSLPEKWNSRVFRKPMDNYVLRNRNEFDDLPIDSIFEKHISEIVKSHNIEKIEESALSFEKEFSPEFMEKMNTEYNWVTEYFQGIGIIIEGGLPPVYLLPSAEDGNGGFSKGSFIALHNLEKIHNKAFKEIEMLSIMSHELYHAASKRVVGIETVPGTNVVRPPFGQSADTSYGISYNLKGGYTGSKALEEGLAYNFQKNMLKKIKTLYSSEVVNFYNNTVSEALSRVDPQLNVEFVQFNALDSDGVGFGYDLYNSSSM